MCWEPNELDAWSICWDICHQTHNSILCSSARTGLIINISEQKQRLITIQTSKSYSSQRRRFWSMTDIMWTTTAWIRRVLTQIMKLSSANVLGTNRHPRANSKQWCQWGCDFIDYWLVNTMQVHHKKCLLMRDKIEALESDKPSNLTMFRKHHQSCETEKEKTK